MYMRKSGAFPTANHSRFARFAKQEDEQSGIAGGTLTASIDLGRSTVVQHDSLSLLQLLLRCLVSAPYLCPLSTQD